jgi:hypothetical protein
MSSQPPPPPPTNVGSPMTVGRGVGELPFAPLSVLDLGQALLSHHGITEGSYEVLVTFAFGVANLGDADGVAPSALISLKEVGLRRVADGSKGPGIVAPKEAVMAAKPRARRSRAK